MTLDTEVPMDLSIFEDMDAPELCKYIEFLLWHYRVADAFWFLYAEEQFGQSVAEKLNERVWGKASEMAAKQLLKRFEIQERGLKGFASALKLYPWTPIVEYVIDAQEDQLILSAPHCPAQEGRLKHGLGEYVCKDMHREEFIRFAQVIDPRIQIECLFAPPDPHPSDLFCKWRFTVASGSK